MVMRESCSDTLKAKKNTNKPQNESSKLSQAVSTISLNLPARQERYKFNPSATYE